MRLGRDDPPGRCGTGEGIGAVRSVDNADAIRYTDAEALDSVKEVEDCTIQPVEEPDVGGADGSLYAALVPPE